MHNAFITHNRLDKLRKIILYSPFTLASNSLRRSDGDVVDDGKYFSCIYADAVPFSINGLVAVEMAANGVVGGQLPASCC